MERNKERNTMGRFFVWATLISGAVAAYMMYRRGESLATIAQKTISNPMGALASEVKATF